MRIAFPIKENRGLDSIVDEHFGVATFFLIVNTESLKFELVSNQKIESGESGCKKGVFKKEDRVDAVVTNCMGDGSKKLLTASNIIVYQAQEKSILQNLELYEKKELKIFHMFDHCLTKKNKKEGGCGHHH